MPFLPLLRLVSSGTLLSIAFMLILGTSSHPSAPLATTTIDFESLSSSGEIVRNQFASRGIIFQPVMGVDYVQGIPIPNFTHSGAKGIELCFAAEFCTSKLDISFTTPQRRVKMWAGYTGRLDRNELVILRAFDANGNEVTLGVNVLGPSTAAIPISRPLEVTTPTATIVRVTAGFIAAEPSIGTMFNNGLAFDDIEFDDEGPAPQCPATQPPGFTANEPLNGQIVVQNAFTLDANLTTPDPFATLQVTATGPGGTRTFGPVFASSGHIQYFNLSGLLSSGQNTLVFTAKDCAGTTQVTRTVIFRAITRTVIRVIDESNVRVQTARVYANNEFIGFTDAEGKLMVTPALPTGTKLVARKFVAESSTYRDNHSQGSNQDWKFRVYTSSSSVNDGGSLTFHPVNYVPDPDAPQVLQVRRRNALIGLHLIASFEWDASAAEMETVKQKLIETSKILYNLTDGQMFIEQAEVVDDAKFWNDADYRIYANQALRAYVDSPLAGFFDDSFWNGSSWIHVRPSSPPAVYAHEFGHYGFGARDEYKDDNASVKCTALLSDTTPGNVFAVGGTKASCIMFDAGQAKLCSNRAENPHKKGTRQGDSSCWNTLAGHFRDSNSNARWIVRTPDTRGAIPGSINGKSLPLDDMAARITFQNGSRPNLCQPILVLSTNSNGTPVEGRDIWVKTTYGRNIFQGKTNPQGNLTVTGVHVGDRVNGTTVQFANCTTTARLGPDQSPREPVFTSVAFSQDVEQGRKPLELAPDPFNIITALHPTSGGARITVTIEDSARRAVTLAKPPAVRFQLEAADYQPVQLRYDAKARGHAGTIAKLPIDGVIKIEVEATDNRGRTMQSISVFQFGRLDPTTENDVMSSDGQLRVTVPAKGLPSGARVAIGPPATGLPALPDGFVFASGPFSVLSYPASKLNQSARVSFELPKDRGISAFANYAKDSVKIFYFDGQKWAELAGVVHPYPIEIVTAETRQLGVFALVAKPTSKQYQQSTFSAELFQTSHVAEFERVLMSIFR